MGVQADAVNPLTPIRRPLVKYRVDINCLATVKNEIIPTRPYTSYNTILHSFGQMSIFLSDLLRRLLLYLGCSKCLLLFIYFFFASGSSYRFIITTSTGSFYFGPKNSKIGFKLSLIVWLVSFQSTPYDLTLQSCLITLSELGPVLTT